VALAVTAGRVVGEIRIFADAARAALAAAELVVTRAAEGALARGSCRLGLSGGRTPEATYRLLARAEFRARAPWSRLQIFFADERDAPPTEPESNYWLTRKRSSATGIRRQRPSNEGRLPISRRRRAVRGAGGGAARSAAARRGRGRTHRFAVPGRRSWPMNAPRGSVRQPQAPPRRLTITPAVITAVQQMSLVIDMGRRRRSDSWDFSTTLESDVPLEECPSRMLRDYEWLLDAAAAAELTQRA
jgi:6-phosphogluconolactonase/glucosamine-6-phosphate isomerase/deaminase